VQELVQELGVQEWVQELLAQELGLLVKLSDHGRKNPLGKPYLVARLPCYDILYHNLI